MALLEGGWDVLVLADDNISACVQQHFHLLHLSHAYVSCYTAISDAYVCACHVLLYLTTLPARHLAAEPITLTVPWSSIGLITCASITSNKITELGKAVLLSLAV